MRRDDCRATAFTLVELLVVIGIIALLIGILLPALKRAKDAANGAVCLSNMRQVANAIAIYQATYKGAICLSYSELFPTYVKGQNVGLTGVTSFKFRYCPTYGQQIAVYNNADVTSGLSFGSYAWNQWVVGVTNAMSPQPYRPSGVKNQSELALMADIIKVRSSTFDYASVTSFADVYGADRATAAANKLAPPTFHGRHLGRGAILWLDGHASLESPTPVPYDVTSSDFIGDETQTPAAFYNKNHIGYLVPPGVNVRSMEALYYSIARKNLASSAVPPNSLFRARVTISGMVTWVPKTEHWN